MIVILGMDGLEYNYVEEFDLPHLKQKKYGKTDISIFSEPRTVVIWTSFLTGRSTEKEALRDLWNFRVKPEETFFSAFERWEAIDVPGLTYLSDRHARERDAMQKVLNGEMSIEEYDAIAFENHKHVKELFFEALEGDLDLLMGYFALPDVIGHMSFGLKPKMRIIYREMDEIARKAQKAADKVLIISDHGMVPVGRYGDHSTYGFWSFSEDIPLERPRVTGFAEIIKRRFIFNF